MSDQYIQISKYVRGNQTIINRRSEEAAKKTKRYYEEEKINKAKKTISRRKKI